MEINKTKGIIEAILFAAGREVNKNELMLELEISEEQLDEIVKQMKEDYRNENRGIQLISIDDAYQLCSKETLHEYVYPVLDKRSKPKISKAAMETLSIIAYNPRITRAELESIRGVNVDGCMYKLLEFGLIEEAGKSDLPGKPMTYKTSKEFLKMFGYNSLNDLPELPKYKLNENQQIVIDELVEENGNQQLVADKQIKEIEKLEVNKDQQLAENKEIEESEE